MYQNLNFPGNDFMSPTSRKRRVSQVERTTGPLSPMRGNYRSIGDLPPQSAHEVIMKPPLSPGSDNSPTMSASSRKMVQPNSRMQRAISSGDSVSTMDSRFSSGSKSRGRRPPSPTNSFGSLCRSSRARGFLDTLFHLGPLFQLLLMFVILMMVLQSHHHANYAQQQLLRYRAEESALLLQLQKIERQSMKLHKNIRSRLQQAGVEVEGSEGTDPLHDQSSELDAMSKELHGQVIALQESIQEEARKSIVQEYGEGPVKVALDLQITEGDALASMSSSSNTRLDILLWPDTPHAAWSILEQVERHVWDGAHFYWSNNQPLLDITPSRSDPMGRGKLEFAEFIPNHPSWHGAWTVGVREEPTTGRLQMFLNLQDNAEYQEHETCVGRVLGGFDTLQRVLGATRQEDGNIPSVTVRQASAMHVTKRDLNVARR